MIILGIETSCDETSAAIIETNGKNNKVKLLSNIISSSLPLHAKTGGIIPEIAAREQVKFIIPVIEKAVEVLKNINEIDAIAVTVGPGLIGSLLVGVETAKTISYVLKKPIIPVNHLFGHIYANWIKTKDQRKIEFPAISLIVSGGHTDLVLMRNHGDLQVIGGSRDDAAGECFDKCARLLGFNYPGGPKIAELAKKGDPKSFQFPRPMLGSHDYDFSFSGLKTAFLNMTKQYLPLSRITLPSNAFWQQTPLENELNNDEKTVLYNLCASLETAIIDTLIKKTMRATKEHAAKSILISGGVASNELLRNQFKTKAEQSELNFFTPEKSLCTDNGAMIAAAAFYNYKEIPWDKVTANPELYFD